MASVAQVHYPHVAGNYRRGHPAWHISSLQLRNFADKKMPFRSSLNFTLFSPKSQAFKPNLLGELQPLLFGGNGSDGTGIGHGSSGGGGDGGGGSGDWSGDERSDDTSKFDSFGPIGAFLSGWRSRVAADPQFVFKVLMEEVVGVSACILGDMASRPNFGLTELDFVFSTLVVGSILNFTLMYLLAPTMSSASASLPSIFVNSPTSHMFEPGPYSLMNRLGTFVYKGAVFAAVGLAAGLVGTALSNGLIKMRKKMDPNFKSPNKPPPMFLNAITWAAHMGVSSNLRYQTLNGIEFLLTKGLPPVVFKTCVFGLRLANNVLGGMTFVILAKMTGAQNSGAEKKPKEIGSVVDKEDQIQLK